MEESASIGVLILAGGYSNRMGFPKPWLPLPNKRTFLENIVSKYVELGLQNIVVVINQRFCTAIWENKVNRLRNYARVIINDRVDQGRMHSLKLGFAEHCDTDQLIIHNVDNPIFEKTLLNVLLDSNNKNDVSIPTYKSKGGHPIVVSNKVVEYVLELKDRDANLRQILKRFSPQYCEVEFKSILQNINTPEQYKDLVGEFAQENR